MSLAPVRSVVAAACPACANTVAAPFFDGGPHPLATLGWPRSADEARAMPRHPHELVRAPPAHPCLEPRLPLRRRALWRRPNRMFNAGLIWKGYLAESCQRLIGRLPAAPTLVEIGCGEGHFIRGLGEACAGRGRFVGFDPSVHPETGQGLEFHPRLFDPLSDMRPSPPTG